MNLLKIPNGIREIVAEGHAKAPVSFSFPSQPRASFTVRYASAVKNESALFSLNDPDSPTFALGLYPDLLVKEETLAVVFTRLPSLVLTPMMVLIAGAFGRITHYQIPEDQSIATFRGSFSRNRTKLMSTLEDPAQIEQIYETTPYIENRTVYFMAPPSPTNPSQPLDKTRPTP